MQVCVLKSKLHRALVTASCVDYEGSLTVAADLMDRVGLYPYERILCGNLANGHRFETYVIPGKPLSGDVILNGATAHLGKPGDRLTIMNFAMIEEDEAKDWAPRVLVLGEANGVVSDRGAPRRHEEVSRP